MTHSSIPSSAPVLVTGATGFTGGALARELGRQGFRVRALVRDPGVATDLSDCGIELFAGDVRDATAVDKAVSGCRIVYHIAAAYRIAGQPDSFYFDVNLEGTRHILESARRHGVERTVHCSTAGVHGHVSKLPSDETAPFNAGDVYQESKLAGELLAQKAIADGQPVSIFRPAGIYGPNEQRFVKLFKTVQRRTFRMFGDGEVAFHLVYIDDLVNGIILCGEHPGALGEIFILCGNEFVTLNRLVELVADSVGVPPPKGHLPIWPLMTAARLCEWVCKPLGIDPPLHPRRCAFFTKARAFTCAKATRLIGYRPQIELPEGLRRTAESYFAAGHLRRT